METENKNIWSKILRITITVLTSSLLPSAYKPAVDNKTKKEDGHFEPSSSFFMVSQQSS